MYHRKRMLLWVERDLLRAERDLLRAERDLLWAERDLLRAERDLLRAVTYLVPQEADAGCEPKVLVDPCPHPVLLNTFYSKRTHSIVKEHIL